MYKNQRFGLFFDYLKCEMQRETILNISYLEKSHGIPHS